MTQAVTVRRDGDTFQARLFWWHAARLLDPQSPITRVGFESGPKSFDDIWVEYDPTKSGADQYGYPLRREHIQCKWHVAPNTYGFRHLTDPDFVNANARSLLQRAHEAQLKYAPDGIGVRFKLLTNWRLDRTDPLRQMVGTRSSAIRLERLYEAASDKSKSGSLRKSWREHLGVNDDELRLLARTLAFGEATDSLEGLRDHLDILLGYVGLKRVPASSSAFLYDDLVFQWMAQGRIEFDRKALENVCNREGLLGPISPRCRVFGVKSFEHSIDRLEQRCEKVLNFVPAFDERFIRNASDWTTELYPKLRDFLLSAARDSDKLRLVLDAHTTLAFAVGSILNVKSGRYVELEQRSTGKRIWAADDEGHDPEWPNPTVEPTELDPLKPDIAVAVSLTHDIKPDVLAFLESQSMPVGRLLRITSSGGSSGQSVRCGRHAFELAEAVVAAIRQERLKKATGMLHFFIAAPNAFTFFLGQHQPLLGNLCLYEYDFEGLRDRSYSSSLALPPILVSGR